MTAPRHLWSGDWEKESVEPDVNQTQPTPTGPEQPQPPEDQDPRRGWRPGRGQVAATVAALLIGAAVAVGLTVALDGNSSSANKTTTLSRSTTTGSQSFSVPGQTTSPTQIPQPSTQPQTQPQTTQPQTQTPTSTQTQTSTIPDLPSVNWLGMEIITGPSGPEVTEVGTGVGNTDGFQPEDLISTFDGKSVDSALQISKIAASLPLGSHIPITVLRGGSVIKMAVTMKERPTVRP